jgi:hypothetical protein
MSHLPPHRRAAAAALVIAFSMVLAACSGSNSTPRPTPSSPTKSSPTPSVASSPPVRVTPPPPTAKRWPLTGFPRTGKLPHHPVYVVKVDNSPAAAPQLGLNYADMIVEELVEGGITRLAAFYYSKIPPQVGPVRSMRASDIGITEPANAFIVASGAAGKTLKLLNEAGIDRVTEGAAGFYRSSSRPAPYNLMMKLPALAHHVARRWKPPSRPYLPFGNAARFHGTIVVRRLTATFSGAHTDDWRLQGKTWVRTDSYGQPGHDFKATNVLILRVRIGDAGYLDPAGNPVPETLFFGTGAATLIHGDRAVQGSWHKAGTRGALTLHTSNGKPITVPAGHTFIELVPANGGSVALHRF